MTNSASTRGGVARALFVTSGVTLLLLVPLPASLATLSEGELFRIGKDKIAHFALFGLLAWVWSAAMSPGELEVSARLGPARATALLAALLVWGGAIEVVQAWSGWRQGEWSDLAADGIGVALALLTRVRWREAQTGPRGRP